VNRGTRLALLGAAVAVVVIAIVITASGGDDNNDSTTTTNQSTQGTTQGTQGTTGTTQATAPKPQVTHIKVVNAKPVDGITKISVKQGDRVRFAVMSDTADEIHVHGYDFMKDVPAGGTITFDFKANISGSFEIELEDHKEQIASLKVEP
jgi:hypothetical protein